jgi:hypothetical protein
MTFEMVARFVRPTTGELAEIFRPGGDTFPIDTRVRWVTPGPGRQTLNDIMRTITVLELDGFAGAIAAGKNYHLEALRELATRDAWDFKATPVGYGLTGSRGESDSVPRLDVLLVTELVVRTAVEPFEGADDSPSWVSRARAVHPDVVEALGGAELFEVA